MTTSTTRSNTSGGASMSSTMMKQVEIPCCVCGTMIYPNAANQCSTCLAQTIDLRDILQRGPGGSHELYVHQCRQCRRFERTEKHYQVIDSLESPILMALLLKRIPALTSSSSSHNKLQLMDTMFVWTEPNSMRLKLRLTVRTEVQSVLIQQRCVVEFIIKFKQCLDCNREYTNRTWHALVQLRQRRDSDSERKSGLTVLEMALARNPTIRRPVLSMDTTKDGFDFYFLSLSEAQRFASYLARIAPLKMKTTQKLVSTDVKNNTANMKHTVVCDMVPLCRDDLILLDKRAKGSRSMHLSGRLALVTKMSSVVHLVDASPARTSSTSGSTTTATSKSSSTNNHGGSYGATSIWQELSPETYYKNGADKMAQVIATSRRLTKFIVLDVELCEDTTLAPASPETSATSTTTPQDSVLYQGKLTSGMSKYALADVTVTRECDFGSNDETFCCVTHLGHLLQVGDTVLGYDMSSLVLSTDDDDWSKCFNASFVMPDVVLVKKVSSTAAAVASMDDMTAVDSTANANEITTTERAKSSRAKKQAKRRQREERKIRELEDAAQRMGFLQAMHDNDENDEDYNNDRNDNGHDTNKSQEAAASSSAATMNTSALFEQELANDADLAEELRDAEQELLLAAAADAALEED